MAAKRYADAVKAYTEALKLMPDNATATRGLQEATQALRAASVQPPPPPVANAQAEFTKRMQEAAGFEKQQRYADAIKAYQEALKVVPGDARATEGLRKADFALHFAEGQRLMTLRRFADAVREYELALQREPGNAAATAALKKARESK
jgi:tetratricopeptide (TPR) repeat protein